MANDSQWFLGTLALLAAGFACASPPDPSPVPPPPPSQSSTQTQLVAPLSPTARTDDEQNTIAVFKAAANATVFVTQNQLVRDKWSFQTVAVPAGAGTGYL